MITILGFFLKTIFYINLVRQRCEGFMFTCSFKLHKYEVKNGGPCNWERYPCKFSLLGSRELIWERQLLNWKWLNCWGSTLLCFYMSWPIHSYLQVLCFLPSFLVLSPSKNKTSVMYFIFLASWHSCRFGETLLLHHLIMHLALLVSGNCTILLWTTCRPSFK